MAVKRSGRPVRRDSMSLIGFFLISSVVQWLGYLAFTEETRVQFPAGENIFFFASFAFCITFCFFHGDDLISSLSALSLVARPLQIA